jgi:NitT/TauT family transport system ATP-binding protein
VFLAQRVVVMTARPGRIKQIVDIDLPWPRVESDVRSSRPFALLRHRIWELLAEEVEKTQHSASPMAPVPGRSRRDVAADAAAQEVV